MKRFEIPEDASLRPEARPEAESPSSERALRNFRYVVAAVNGDAQQTWSDLWNQLKPGVTPGGMVLPQTQEGFKPPCGWTEFLEKFWLLKHYIDCVQKLCTERHGT